MIKIVENFMGFQDKEESFMAGVRFMLVANLIFIAALLVMHVVARFFDFIAMGPMYFFWFLLNASMLSKQLYVMVVSGCIKRPIASMDWGALFASMVAMMALVLFCDYKFSLFPVTDASRPAVTMAGVVTAIALGHAALTNGRSVCEIGFTLDQSEADQKTIFIEREKLIWFRVACYAVPFLVVIGLFARFML